MYSKEEAKQIRIEFWEQFRMFTNKRRKTRGKGKWILDRTGIKAINLKFYFDNDKAQVGIDIETNSLDKRIQYYEKLEGLKTQINGALGENTRWELEYIRENNKSVSRIYTEIQEVNIFDAKTWNRVNMFLFDRMTALEKVFVDYKDYLV